MVCSVARFHVSVDIVYLTCVLIIRILHECEELIEKSVPRVTVWHHEAPPRDISVDQYIKLMIYSFSCTPMGSDA